MPIRKEVMMVAVLAVGMGIGLSMRTTPVQAAATTPVIEGHPAIEAALRNLRQAKADLEKGNHDFGGHRVAALKDTEAAISECEQALKFDK